VNRHPPTQLVRARRLGFDLEAPHRLIVVELQNNEAGDLQAISRSLRHRHADAPLWLIDGDRLVAATVDDITVARRVAASSHAAAPTPSAISVGISSSSRNFPTTYREATAAAGLARVGATAPLAVEHGALGPLKFMLDVDDPSHARTLVREQLLTLREYDAQHETQLLTTLQAFIDAGGHHSTIATRCHVHPSTVKYRLRRIEELTNRNLDDVGVRFELAIAVRLLALFNNLGIDLLAD
jgi:DNA-binding PucR family transcriptional regulator